MIFLKFTKKEPNPMGVKDYLQAVNEIFEVKELEMRNSRSLGVFYPGRTPGQKQLLWTVWNW